MVMLNVQEICNASKGMVLNQFPDALLEEVMTLAGVITVMMPIQSLKPNFLYEPRSKRTPLNQIRLSMTSMVSQHTPIQR